MLYSASMHLALYSSSLKRVGSLFEYLLTTLHTPKIAQVDIININFFSVSLNDSSEEQQCHLMHNGPRNYQLLYTETVMGILALGQRQSNSEL